jgi:lysyl-tRNA synthetase class 2
MRFTEGILSYMVRKIFGTTKITSYGKEIEFAPPYKVVSLAGAIKEKTGEDVLAWKGDKEAEAAARKHGVECAVYTSAHVIDALFDKYVQPELIQPTFLIDFPAFMCPLAKPKRGDPRLAERFELFIGGGECGNSYSEINDPVLQRAKFEDQARELAKGDEEAMPLDEDFLESMEYGMPPMGGMGIGIERLAMILTSNESIKEVILFPSMRPLKPNPIPAKKEEKKASKKKA